MKLDRDSRPRLAAKVRLQYDRHSGQHLLIYPERGMRLDETATAIISRCDGQRSVAAISAELASLFVITDAGQIEADALEFLQALADRALLVVT